MFLARFKSSGLDDDDVGSDHHDQPFKVIERLDDGYERRRLWLVRFDDGAEHKAFDVEVEAEEWRLFNDERHV